MEVREFEMRRSSRRYLRKNLRQVDEDEGVVREARERDQSQGRGRGIEVRAQGQGGGRGGA